MNRKYLLILILIIVYLLSSCNETKNKIIDEKVRDSVVVDLPVKSIQEEEKHEVLHFDPVNFDTIIGSYHVLYKIQDNRQIIVKKYPGYNGEEGDRVYYADQDVMLTINKDGKNILLNKKIQRDDFRSFMPKEEMSQYGICSFFIKDVTTDGVKFSINICIPDTDLCYPFELFILDSGDIKITEEIEVYETETETETINAS